MTSSQPSTSPKTQTSKSYPGKGQRSEIPGCHELGAGVINPGERVTHLRKQQSSGSNPDSAKPTSALSAIHYGHKQGPSAFPCPRPLGCWVHLSQKKKKLWAKTGKPESHFTSWDETPGPFYCYDGALSASPFRPHSLDACKSLQCLYNAFTYVAPQSDWPSDNFTRSEQSPPFVW